MAASGAAVNSLPARPSPRELESAPLLGTQGHKIKKGICELLETYWADRRREGHEPQLIQIDEYYVMGSDSRRPDSAVMDSIRIPMQRVDDFHGADRSADLRTPRQRGHYPSEESV